MRKGAVAAVCATAVVLLTGAKGCASAGIGGGDLNKATAIGACEGSVKKQLKAPATADFGGEHAYKVSSTEYRIGGYVDAENSFGAKLRNTWSGVATTKNGGDTWWCSATLHGQ